MNRIPRRARKSVFFGIRSFCTLPKVTGLPEVIEAENRTAMMNSKQTEQETQRVSRLFSNHYGVLFFYFADCFSDK